jgi:hypothetical protein
MFTSVRKADKTEVGKRDASRIPQAESCSLPGRLAGRCLVERLSGAVSRIRGVSRLKEKAEQVARYAEMRVNRFEEAATVSHML